MTKRVARMLAVLAALAPVGLAREAAAEVIERSEDHFVLRYATAMEAPAEDVWASVGDLPLWWNPDHTYTGDVANLTLSLTPGGCFCEKLADGTTFEHGIVREADPELGVLFEAALGPLKGKTTLARWEFGWTGSGGEVVMSYMVRGPGLGAFADAVDGVMQDQYSRLIHFIHYGEPPSDEPFAWPSTEGLKPGS